MVSRAVKLRLGEMLLADGLITPEQLQAALDGQRQGGQRLGAILLEQGAISERTLFATLARQLGMAFVDWRGLEPDTVACARLTEAHARRLRVLPVRLPERADDAGVVLAVADPLDVDATAAAERWLGGGLEAVVVEESRLSALHEQAFRRGSALPSLAREVERDLSLNDEAIDLSKMVQTARADDAPAVRLLHTVLTDALRARASDIHIEPQERGLQIRFRVDGMLQHQAELDAKLGPVLVLRLKVVAGLDIVERRMPQDGRFAAQVDGAGVDIRVSTLPTHYGEAVVMRILGRSTRPLPLDQLGLPAAMASTLRQFAERDAGMIVVTGPTGSGKTATLYGLLEAMDRTQRKVMTVEDPVEIRLPGTVQVPVNERIGLGFAQVLRAMLRQDPDVLLVGEMRDPQTVETGLRAAMTGHTVLSTLHTHSTASTPARLIDMGAPPFLVAMALRMVLAQRLVRRVCPDCAAPRVLDAAERAFVQRWQPDWQDAGRVLQGIGCSRCAGTGCRGRVGVFEMLTLDEALADRLVRGDSVGFATAARQRVGEATLARHAVERVCAGEIPLDEAMRVALSGEVG